MLSSCVLGDQNQSSSLNRCLFEIDGGDIELEAKHRGQSLLADDPLFEVGEEYLLFLKLSESGRYFHPGPWGRYKIIDGMVYSMNHILRDSQYQAPPQLDFNGVAINTFIEHINVVLGAVR